MSTYYYIGCPVCRAEGPMLFADKMGWLLAAQPVVEQLAAAAEFAERHRAHVGGIDRLVIVSEHAEWAADR